MQIIPTKKTTFIDGIFPTGHEFINEYKISNAESIIADLRIQNKYSFTLHVFEDFTLKENVDAKILFCVGNIEYGIYKEELYFIIFDTKYGDRAISFFSNSEESIKEFNHIVKDNIYVPVNTEYHISYYYRSGDGFDSSDLRKKHDFFKETHGYYYPYFNASELCDLYIESTENILILSGPPGTGKTSFAKYIMKEISRHVGNKQVKIVFIKDKDLLSQDRIWTSIVKGEIDFVIMDDLDDSLEPRETSRWINAKGQEMKGNPFVDKFLSISDGFFNVKTKFIITTNREIGTIDNALLRPGRCFDVLSVRFLTRDEGLKIWTDNYELTEESFNRYFDSNVKYIPQSNLKSEYQREISHKKSYMYDESISIRNDLMETKQKRKKIGFDMEPK